MRTILLMLVRLFAAQGAVAAGPPKKILPLDGEVFEVSGRAAFLIPAKADPYAKGKPWVWYAPTLPNLPGPEERWMFEKFRAAGIAVAGIDAGESYGSPAGNKVFDALYAEMTTRGYSAKPVLLGRSRGGLMTLSWAAGHPDKVGGFAGIYPVCDLASYPGVERAAGAFQMKADELKARLKEFNPADRLAGLAQARVPLFAIHGDADKVVPLEANSGRVKERYAALGASMTLVVPPRQGHSMWPGFFRCTELVEFVIANAGVGVVLDSPQDYQVAQRDAKNVGTVRVRGKLGEAARKADALAYRVGTEGKSGAWRGLDARVKDGRFEATITVAAGGWYRLDVRATAGGKAVAQATVERVGVGEVFVVAGQSNSANHGAEKQRSRTGRVAAFDGTRWQPANDPQPGASGSGGSFLPPFGDAVAEKFGVPVGLVACGVGATSVREWLPRGATFPNPPTLEGHVRKRADGRWESKGDLYVSLCNRMKQLGPHGFRAVLWHQGESDANQRDTARTLQGTLYREHMERLIRDSRTEIGWEAPWFVAQVSYHEPGDESSPDIRAAQAALWKAGVALEGPDSDALKGDFRDNGGKGVHFSGLGLRAHASRWLEKVGPWLEREIAGTGRRPAGAGRRSIPEIYKKRHAHLDTVGRIRHNRTKTWDYRSPAMLTKTGLHAVRALVALARLPDGVYAGAARVAQEIDAPQNYLGKLLKTLGDEGLVESQKGLGGGFRLARDPKDISLLDVVEPIEHVSRWSGCILGRSECSEVDPCAIHNRWKAVRQAYLQMLERTTIAELVAKGEGAALSV